MEKYDNLGMVGEGSYGMVMKCKHKESGQIVAIKKFLESEDDKMVKKIAMREVRMLRKLRHENLVNLIEVFRRRKRLYLVFEFVDHTVLDDLEKYPNGLSEMTVRKILWQVLRGVEFCHSHNIIHRDIKPENILNSRSGVIKLCDFGFARTLAAPGEIYTDYVATRWYRAPELLVGDTKYGRGVDIWAVGCLVGEMLQGDPIFPGKSDIDQLNRILKPVDIWAVGCLITEMLTGDPLFPGDSDIDQLYHIIKCFGNLCPRHREIFQRNPLFAGMRLPDVRDVDPLEKRFPKFSSEVLDLMKQCLRLDPNDRPSSSLLLRHEFFKKDNFEEKVIPELRNRIIKDNANNALARKEANEKKEQEKRKKKNKELAANALTESKDSGNIPSPKKTEAKNTTGSPSKNETGSPKKDKAVNKTPTMSLSREEKRNRKDTENENKSKTNTPKQLPAVDKTRQASNVSDKSAREAASSERAAVVPKKELRFSDKSPLTPRGHEAKDSSGVLHKSLTNTPTNEHRMPSIQKKRVTIDLPDNQEQQHHVGGTAVSNGILKTPPGTKHAGKIEASLQEERREREAAVAAKEQKRRGVKTPNAKNSSSDTQVAKDRSSRSTDRPLPLTPPQRHEQKLYGKRSPKQPPPEAESRPSAIPPLQQVASKASTPDPFLLVSSTASSSPHPHGGKQPPLATLAGPPSFRGSEKLKKGSTVNLRKSDTNSQGSFDRSMYPDKTSNFEKMMMSMSGATSISHPAIKKSNQSSLQGMQFQYKSNRDEKPSSLPIWSSGNNDSSFHHTSSLESNRGSDLKLKQSDDKRLREKSPKHTRKEGKSYHHGMEERPQREMKAEKNVTRLPDLGHRNLMGMERDHYSDLKPLNSDSVLKAKKPKTKSILSSIPNLHEQAQSSSKHHKNSRSPSPTYNDSNFPSVHFKN